MKQSFNHDTWSTEFYIEKVFIEKFGCPEANLVHLIGRLRILLT